MFVASHRGVPPSCPTRRRHGTAKRSTVRPTRPTRPTRRRRSRDGHGPSPFRRPHAPLWNVSARVAQHALQLRLARAGGGQLQGDRRHTTETARTFARDNYRALSGRRSRDTHRAMFGVWVRARARFRWKVVVPSVVYGERFFEILEIVLIEDLSVEKIHKRRTTRIQLKRYERLFSSLYIVTNVTIRRTLFASQFYTHVRKLQITLTLFQLNVEF